MVGRAATRAGRERMTPADLKFGVTLLVITALLTILVIQHRTQASLRAGNQSFRQQISQLQGEEGLSNRGARTKARHAPRLPAPPVEPAVAGASAADELQSTNLYARLKDKERKLSAEQIEAYLQANRRNAGSLLAAYRNTGDLALLEEAKQTFPNNPLVAFEAALRKDVSPEESRQWLDALKKSAPDNSLANYLSALDCFKNGQSDQAVQELIAASGKSQFQDYRLDRVQDAEEALLSAGYTAAEAKILSDVHTPLPQLHALRDLTMNMIDLAKSYRQAGDESSARAALEMVVSLGQRYADAPTGQPLISYASGLRFERRAFEAMEPDAAYGEDAQTVQDRLSQVNQQLAGVKQLADLWNDDFLAKLSDQDWVSYCDRLKAFGDQTAMRWALDKYGQK